jgi:transposase, IS30 family
MMRSITLDNGREMNDYEEIERHLNKPVYFAHPYHSWERGTNENTNGLLRQFFPKNRNFSTITKDELDLAVNLINTKNNKKSTISSHNSKNCYLYVYMLIKHCCQVPL